MPGAHGGDNQDEDYAPHMYINHKFVGNNTKEVELRKWCYTVGRVGGISNKYGRIIAERWPIGTRFTEIPDKTKTVPSKRIPKKVRLALKQKAEGLNF